MDAVRLIWLVLSRIFGPAKWRTHDGHEKREIKCPICDLSLDEHGPDHEGHSEWHCPSHGRVYQIWPDGHASMGLEKYRR